MEEKLWVITMIACVLIGGVMGTVNPMWGNRCKSDEPEYEYNLYKLDNSNEFINAKIIDYICTDNVIVHDHKDAIYISTWKGSFDYKGDGKGDYGECYIKTRSN